MNQQWVDNYNKRIIKEREELREHIVQELKTYPYIDDKDRNEIIEKMYNKDEMWTVEIDLPLGYLNYTDEIPETSFKEYREWVKSLNIGKCVAMFKTDNPGDRYLDRSIDFNGDIIITDPCYIRRDGEEFDYYDEDVMNSYGIQHYMFRDTLYGDWSCTTYDLDTKKPIGQFCADSGNVGVFLLDEVLRYNPYFDGHINRLWTTTLIKDFDGTVQFVVKEDKCAYKGKEWIDYYLEVEGHGVNKVSGESINFVGKQTGF